MVWGCANFNATFPFPQVFSLSPFPLAREPTVTAWRGTTLGRDITNAISLIVPLRFVRRLRNNMAQSLVLIVKLGVRYGRRLAAPNPSSKSHIPFISTPRIGFPFVAKGRLYAELRLMIATLRKPLKREKSRNMGESGRWGMIFG